MFVCVYVRWFVTVTVRTWRLWVCRGSNLTLTVLVTGNESTQPPTGRTPPDADTLCMCVCVDMIEVFTLLECCLQHYC